MKKLLLIFLIIFSSQSFAEWEFVTSSDNGSDTYFIDIDTIRENDGYIYFWQLVSFKKPEIAGDLILKSYKVYRQADCNLFRLKDIQTFFYSEEFGKGNLSYKMDDKGSWLYPPPSSTSNTILKRVCE